MFNKITTEYVKHTRFLKKLSLFYQHCLNKHQDIQDYLLEDRKLTKDSIQRFGIGYSPSTELLLQFLQKNNLDEDLLFKTGTFIQKEDTSFDLFAGRIIFPIQDIRGDVVAFSGRDTQNDSKCKYINSATSCVFSKSLSLFNINRAYEFIQQDNYAILVEGLMDVVTMWQGGILNVVAPCGTSFTKEQAWILKYLTDKLFLLFDNDFAGKRAASRAEILCKQISLEFTSVKLSGAKDPDEFIKNYGSSNIKSILY